ncbi:MAG: ABC transporter substrate-binding protein [Firmicutes bacterium]|nr:ABC transporter substrate-binding protein [Bacillota bacterium]
MKKYLITILIAAMALCFTACGSGGSGDSAESADGSTLIYGSNDYTRINPAIDEHGEINLLIFDGLMGHNEKNEVVPALAESYDLDKDTNTYTFHLREGVTWHDGEPFTANDVRFTIEAIMNPDNESEIFSNYEDIEKIEVIDDQTVSFQLKDPNVAFLEYMTIGILPAHLLEGKDMQSDEYFRAPVGTGPYKFEAWDEGQSITLAKNEDYWGGAPNIDTVIFKIVVDDNAKALQLQSGELNLAQVTPKDAQTFAGDDAYTIYHMETSDYRGIMYNFNNPFWQENKALIHAIDRAVDRDAMVESVLLGEGIPAFGALARNEYNDAKAGQVDYDPAEAKKLIEAEGWSLGDDGIYEKDGQKLSFTINCKEGDQVRADLAAIACQNLQDIGVDANYEVRSEIDWENQEAFLIGWGSPFDADDHTYKVFGTDKGNNYSYYSNPAVDEALTKARQTADPKERQKYYSDFQQALAEDPAYTFFCYVDVNYVSNLPIQGITTDTILGHHGVGIFWNVKEWTIDAE